MGRPVRIFRCRIRACADYGGSGKRGAQANPAGAPDRTTGKTMSLVLNDQVTHEPIAGLDGSEQLAESILGEERRGGKS